MGVWDCVPPSVKNIVLRVYENRNLRNTFESKTVDVTGGWRKMHNEELHICTCQMLWGWSNQGSWDGWNMLHVCWKGYKSPHTLNKSATLYFCLIHNLSGHPHACNQLASCLTVDCFLCSSYWHCQVCWCGALGGRHRSWPGVLMSGICHTHTPLSGSSHDTQMEWLVVECFQCWNALCGL